MGQTPPSPFVQLGEWYSEAINWAVASGVMKGYEGTGRFGVGDALIRELRATETLNRAQMCTMIVNAIDVGVL